MKALRWTIALFAIFILLLSFQFRTFNFTGVLVGFGKSDIRVWVIITNKVVRYLVNDLAALSLLWVLFRRPDYLKLAVVVLLFGLFLLLPMYLAAYFLFRDQLGVTLSYLHRLIMNPTLMMLLIPLFYYQRRLENEIIKV